MIFLVIITFIAELIITCTIVTKTIAISNKARLLSDEIAMNQDDLLDVLETMKQVTINIYDFILSVKSDIIRHRNKFILTQLRNTLKAMLIFSLKPKYRKLLVGIKFGSKIINKLSKKSMCYKNK